MYNENANRSFVRWQGRTNNQLGFTVNTILTLSTGALGFALKILIDNNFCCYSNIFLKIASFLFALSIFFGIATSINRLYDFRITTQIAKKRGKGFTDDYLKDVRSVARGRGRNTYVLLTLQLISFGGGILFSSIVLLLL